MEDPPSILTRFRFPILGILLATIVLGLLLLLTKTQFLSPYKVEVITATASPPTTALPSITPKVFTVDISGAVVSPDVYELPQGSRIGDALDLAGGLAKSADTAWVNKNINRAAPVVDGQKVYIPTIEEPKSVLGATSATQETPNLNSNVQVLSPVNINAATQKDLEALWGIGPATAQKLIENRPYSAVEELLSKKILKKNVYDRLKDQLSVF